MLTVMREISFEIVTIILTGQRIDMLISEKTLFLVKYLKTEWKKLMFVATHSEVQSFGIKRLDNTHRRGGVNGS